jgi:hypothetical protein
MGGTTEMALTEIELDHIARDKDVVDLVMKIWGP